MRSSTVRGKESPYFGVINIGDVASFKKLIKEQLEIEVQADSFSKSQFEEIRMPDSRVNILIGAKKFIEGWSSWRVSSMGLMNVGKGEGSQIIQLFGRGVRLKGKNMTLKRTEALPEITSGPPELRIWKRSISSDGTLILWAASGTTLNRKTLERIFILRQG